MAVKNNARPESAAPGFDWFKLLSSDWAHGESPTGHFHSAYNHYSSGVRSLWSVKRRYWLWVAPIQTRSDSLRWGRTSQSRESLSFGATRINQTRVQMSGGFGAGTLNMLVLLAVVVIVMLGYC